MPTASISDVTNVISTSLDTNSGGPIDNSLTYAQELNQEFNDESNQTTTQTKNIERWAAIVNIRQHKERSVSQDSVGGASSTFEGDELGRALANLRTWLRRAGGDLDMLDAFDTTIRDSSRRVGTSTQSSDTQSDDAGNVTSL